MKYISQNRFIYFEAWYVAREETHFGKPKLSMFLLDSLLQILAPLFGGISWDLKVVFVSQILASTEHLCMHTEAYHPGDMLLMHIKLAYV